MDPKIFGFETAPAARTNNVFVATLSCKVGGIFFSMFFLGWFFVTFSCPVQKKRITSLENHNQLVLGFILCKTLTPKLLNLKVSNKNNTVSRTVVFFVASKNPLGLLGTFLLPISTATSLTSRSITCREEGEIWIPVGSRSWIGFFDSTWVPGNSFSTKCSRLFLGEFLKRTYRLQKGIILEENLLLVFFPRGA